MRSIGPTRGSFRFVGYVAVAVGWSLAAVMAVSGAQPVRAAAALPRYDQPPAADLNFAVAAAPDRKVLIAASLQLPALLGQHSVLVADMTRGRLRSDPDLAQATNAALGKNTTELAGLIRALFGDAAATQFSRLWSGHITAYFNYARGLSEHDTTISSESHATITKFETDIGAFLSRASGGRLSPAAADAVVRVHLSHLTHQADAYSAGNYAQADQIYRAAYAQGFELGKALDRTLLPAGVSAAMTTPAWQLQSELDRLLGEHVVLAVAAMRSAATNGADFAANAASVDANTKDLARAVDTLFGTAAAKRFQGIWADHVDALISYSTALVKGDATQRGRARTALSGFERQLTTFLAGATRNRLVGSGLAATLRTQDGMLTGQVEAFVAKNYARSHDLAYSTYQNMITLAGQMATAFRLTLGTRLPLGAVEAGRGGMAAGTEGR